MVLARCGISSLPPIPCPYRPVGMYWLVGILHGHTLDVNSLLFLKNLPRDGIGTVGDLLASSNTVSIPAGRNVLVGWNPAWSHARCQLPAVSEKPASRWYWHGWGSPRFLQYRVHTGRSECTGWLESCMVTRSMSTPCCF